MLAHTRSGAASMPSTIEPTGAAAGSARFGQFASGLGLVLHASQRVHVPGEQWSYLGTAWLGAVTMGGFLALIPPDAPIAYRASVPLFLMSGVALSVGAHVIDGAVPRGPGQGDG